MDWLFTVAEALAVDIIGDTPWQLHVKVSSMTVREPIKHAGQLMPCQSSAHAKPH